MQRRTSLIALAGLLASCGSEPSGTLTLTVDALPALVTDAAIRVSGSVTRSPAKDDAVIVIAIAGGRRTVVDTLMVERDFDLAVDLNPNRENQLAITASDETGSISAPAVHVIFHDDLGPNIVSQTPSNRAQNVALDTPIEFRFGEPLIATGGSAMVSLLRNAEVVAGDFEISPDSLRLTYLPTSRLEPNAVYEIVVDGFTDEAGNPVGSNQQLCFVTTAEGFVTSESVDSTDQFTWQTTNPQPSGVDPVNFRRIVFARDGLTLYGLLQFASPRRFAEDGTNSATALIEIDADRDGSTGFQSAKDQIFTGIPEPTGPFPSSGLGIEFVIGVEPLDAIGGNAYVAVVIPGDSINVVDQFIPGSCGAFFGFDTTTLFDDLGEDGSFDFSILAFAFGTGGFVDPAPTESGSFTADLVITSPPRSVAGAETGVRAAIPSRPRWPLRRR